MFNDYKTHKDNRHYSDFNPWRFLYNLFSELSMNGPVIFLTWILAKHNLYGNETQFLDFSQFLSISSQFYWEISNEVKDETFQVQIPYFYLNPLIVCLPDKSRGPFTVNISSLHFK